MEIAHRVRVQFPRLPVPGLHQVSPSLPCQLEVDPAAGVCPARLRDLKARAAEALGDEELEIFAGNAAQQGPRCVVGDGAAQVRALPAPERRHSGGDEQRERRQVLSDLCQKYQELDQRGHRHVRGTLRCRHLNRGEWVQHRVGGERGEQHRPPGQADRQVVEVLENVAKRRGH